MLEKTIVSNLQCFANIMLVQIHFALNNKKKDAHMFLESYLINLLIALSAGAVEYTDCSSAEG